MAAFFSQRPMQGKLSSNFSFALIAFCLNFAFPEILVAQPLDVTIESQSLHCYGNNDGWAQANPSGGNPPYTYQWTNAAGIDLGTDSLIMQLAPGTYIVVVQDAAGASITKSVSITTPSQLGATAYAQSQICAVSPDGIATAVPYGGTPPYTYFWSNGSNTAMITGLTGGTYTVTVTDANGCTQTASSQVLYFGNEGIWTTSAVQNASCPAANNGLISAMPMSGTAPYQYLWSTGETTAEILNLGMGTYKATITDVNGCAGTVQETIFLDTTSLNIATLLTNALCQQDPETFYVADSLFFDQFTWKSTEPTDIIVHIPGAAHATFIWSNTGPRVITAEQLHTGTPCKSVSSWTFAVKSCVNPTTDLALEKHLISPNPFSGFLDIRGCNDAATRFTLTDMMGRTLLKGECKGGFTRLDTQLLPEGVYLLHINGDRDEVFTVLKGK